MKRWSLVMLMLLCMAMPARAVSLRTVSAFGGTDASALSYVELLREYEAQTGNVVEDTSGTSDESWKASVLSDFAAGNEPDILFFFACSADSAPILRKMVPIAEINAVVFLEIIKKAIGLSTICLTSLVFRSINAIVIGQVISNFVCVFVNAHPNKKVIGYGYLEQARDVFPAFVLALASAAIALPLGRLGCAPPTLALAQLATFSVAYLVLARLFHVEAFDYLLATLSEIKMKRSAS